MRTIAAWIDGGSSEPEAALTIGKADPDNSFVEIGVLLNRASLVELMAEAGHHVRTM